MQKTVWKLVKGKWVKIERFWVRVKKKMALTQFAQRESRADPDET